MERKTGFHGWPCFFKVLVGDFSKRVQIPPGYAKYVDQTTLPQKFRLQSSGKSHWQVDLVKIDHKLFFVNGWRDFVGENGLELGDFVVFNHVQRSMFNVTFFGRTACKKDATDVRRKGDNLCSYKERKTKINNQQAREKSSRLDHEERNAEMMEDVNPVISVEEITESGKKRKRTESKRSVPSSQPLSIQKKRNACKTGVTVVTKNGDNLFSDKERKKERKTKMSNQQAHEKRSMLDHERRNKKMEDVKPVMIVEEITELGKKRTMTDSKRPVNSQLLSIQKNRNACKTGATVVTRNVDNLCSDKGRKKEGKPKMNNQRVREKRSMLDHEERYTKMMEYVKPVIIVEEITELEKKRKSKESKRSVPISRPLSIQASGSIVARSEKAAGSKKLNGF